MKNCSSIKKILSTFYENPGCFARLHKKSTGWLCYRILDEGINPILNVKRRAIENLLSTDRLVKSITGKISLADATREKLDRKYSPVIHKVINNAEK